GGGVRGDLSRTRAGRFVHRRVCRKLNTKDTKYTKFFSFPFVLLVPFVVKGLKHGKNYNARGDLASAHGRNGSRSICFYFGRRSRRMGRDLRGHQRFL